MTDETCDKDVVERLDELASNFRSREIEVRKLSAEKENYKKVLYARREELMVQKKGNDERRAKKDSFSHQGDQKYAQLQELTEKIRVNEATKSEHYRHLASAERHLEEVEQQEANRIREFTAIVNEITDRQMEARNKYREYMSFSTHEKSS